MNNRAKLEQEIIKNINSMSLDDIFLISSGSAEQINMIMMRLINQNHHKYSARNKSTCCQIHRLSAA